MSKKTLPPLKKTVKTSCYAMECGCSTRFNVPVHGNANQLAPLLPCLTVNGKIASQLAALQPMKEGWTSTSSSMTISGMLLTKVSKTWTFSLMIILEVG